LLSYSHDSELDSRGCHEYESAKEAINISQECESLKSRIGDELTSEKGLELYELCFKMKSLGRSLKQYESSNNIEIKTEHCH